MVKRIIWSVKAVFTFNRILEFYYQRNGNKTYSNRLNKQIKESLALLKKHPFLGRKTETTHVRVLIKGDYKIFYAIFENDIIILMVWDCRLNPESFTI